MNVLYFTVSKLDREQTKSLQYYLQRSQHTTGRKDIQLLELYLKSAQEPDDAKIMKRLAYSAGEKNAFYRLKNRLLEDINKVLSLLHAEKDSYGRTLHWLSLYRHWKNNKNTLLAFHYLKKAEKLALEGEFHEISDMIYGEMILLSPEFLEINPEEIAEKRKLNLEKLNLARELDQAVAILNYRLKVNQNIGEKKTKDLASYESLLKEFSDRPDMYTSPVFRIRLYKAMTRILVQKEDYETLEKLLVQTFDEFEAQHLFTRQTHDIKIEMLIYLVNTLNALVKPKEALLYCDILSKALDEYGRLHYERFSYFYYQGLVASYATLHPEKAIHILEGMLENKDYRVDDFYDIFIYSNLAICQTRIKQYGAALKSLNRVYLNDQFDKTGLALQLKLLCYESVARIETSNNEAFSQKLERFIREHEKSEDWRKSWEGPFLQWVLYILTDQLEYPEKWLENSASELNLENPEFPLLWIKPRVERILRRKR